MKHEHGFTLVELMIVVVIIGILAAFATSNWLSMQDRAKEASTKGNCHTVQLAAEDFAIRNSGVYAAAAADVTPDGSNLQALLPGGNLLMNPFDRQITEPHFAAAVLPGETGYQVILQNGVNVGYTIDGMGSFPAGGPVIILTSGQ